jgi:hypothetical protein
VPTAHDGRWSLVVDGDVTPLIGSGSIEVSGSARAELHTGGAEPEAFALGQNYPNPVNPSTTIRYQLPVDGDLSLRIFDTAGQLVRELVQGRQPAGTYSVVWDGQRREGRSGGQRGVSVSAPLRTLRAGAQDANDEIGRRR